MKMILLLCGLAISVGKSEAQSTAKVDLLLAAPRSVQYGEIFLVPVIARSDESVNVATIEIVLEYEEDLMFLTGWHEPKYDWPMSGFYPDAELDGLNNSWIDGDAWLECMAEFNEVFEVDQQGELVGFLEFVAWAPGGVDGGTIHLAMVPSCDDCEYAKTRVMSVFESDKDVTGNMDEAWINLEPDL